MDDRKIGAGYESLDRLLDALAAGVGNRVSLPTGGSEHFEKASASTWRTRLRGMIGVGVTWAVLWGLAGGLMWLLMTAADYGLNSLSIALFLGRQYAIVGFLGGLTFSALLRLADGRRRFDELRTSRFAGWGALGGLLIGGGYSGLLMALFGGGFDAPTAEFVAIATLFGAGSAAGSLAVARRAKDRQGLEPSKTTDMGPLPDGGRLRLPEGRDPGDGSGAA